VVVPLPALLNLPDEASYRAYFGRRFVQGGPIRTHDGIEVRFHKNNFDHAFFRESRRGAGIKDTFDRTRAERMEWIRAVLTDPMAEAYRRQMPDRRRPSRRTTRRIAVVPSAPYAVIIQVNRSGKTANFVTAYVPGKTALQKMRSNPRW
jgi:hypothetical protein